MLFACCVEEEVGIVGLDWEVEGTACSGAILGRIGWGISGIGWLTEALGSILGTSWNQKSHSYMFPLECYFWWKMVDFQGRWHRISW